MAINVGDALPPHAIAVNTTTLEETESVEDRPVAGNGDPALITRQAKVERAEQVFFTEDRDRYWAANSESSLSAALDAVPGRPNFDVTVECHATFCRVTAQAYPQIMTIVGKDADWEAGVEEVLKAPPQNEIFDGQVTNLHVDRSSGVVTIVSLLHRHAATD